MSEAENRKRREAEIKQALAFKWNVPSSSKTSRKHQARKRE